jgi:hypothetical protein
MTGPKLLAEGLALLADTKNADPEVDPKDIEMALRFAQVHLLGALVIATVEAAKLPHRRGDGTQNDWHRAIHWDGAS